jgi:hypothetical protein
MKATFSPLFRLTTNMADTKKQKQVVDVPADDPVGTMDRFTQGLRRVLAVPKTVIIKRPVKRRKLASRRAAN